MRFIDTWNITLGTLLRTISLGVLILIVIWYVHFQARNFLEGPAISLDETGGTIHSEQTILLTGSAHNIVKLTLNGREIHTNEQGEFEQTLVLEQGYTIMTLSARDRFGRTTTVSKEYVYVPLSTEAGTTPREV